jgi:sporulation protein YlmC with PRC-barrel domain
MAKVTNSGPDTRHRVVLRLLDHQVVGPDGQLLGNVDGLRVRLTDDEWLVTALAVGPAALGQRLPGRLGRWTVAVWRRLQTSPDPGPAVVPVAQVTDIGSALRVDQEAAELLAASFGLELWLRRYVISQIPGAKGGGDERGGAAAAGRGPDDTMTSDGVGDVDETEASRGPSGGAATQSISGLIQAEVFAEDGTALGRVNEVICTARTGDRRDHLRITHLEYGHRSAGSKLGYNERSDQGPLMVGALVRWWQRGSRLAPVEDVTAVDLAASRVTAKGHLDHVHPHQL